LNTTRCLCRGCSFSGRLNARQCTTCLAACMPRKSIGINFMLVSLSRGMSSKMRGRSWISAPGMRCGFPAVSVLSTKNSRWFSSLSRHGMGIYERVVPGWASKQSTTQISLSDKEPYEFLAKVSPWSAELGVRVKRTRYSPWSSLPIRPTIVKDVNPFRRKTSCASGSSFAAIGSSAETSRTDPPMMAKATKHPPTSSKNFLPVHLIGVRILIFTPGFVLNILCRGRFLPHCGLRYFGVLPGYPVPNGDSSKVMLE
jgi:hypothetical protein